MPPASSTECTVTMLGWFSAATALASRANRARRSSSSASAGGRTLERHLAIERGVLGQIHVAHPTGADLAPDSVVADRLADHQVPFVSPRVRPSVTGRRSRSKRVASAVSPFRDRLMGTSSDTIDFGQRCSSRRPRSSLRARRGCRSKNRRGPAFRGTDNRCSVGAPPGADLAVRSTQRRLSRVMQVEGWKASPFC